MDVLDRSCFSRAGDKTTNTGGLIDDGNWGLDKHRINGVRLPHRPVEVLDEFTLYMSEGGTMHTSSYEDEVEEDGSPPPTVSLGMRLAASPENNAQGHVVDEVIPNEFAHNLRLQPGDRIMYIDNSPVSSWHGDFVLQYIDNARAKVENLELVIFRSKTLKDGTIETEEIIIVFEVIHLARGESLVRCMVRVLRAKIKPPDFLTDVNFREQTTCLIRVNDSPHYLTVNNKGKPTARPLGASGIHDVQCHFVRYAFDGISGKPKQQKRRFLSVFRSAASQEYLCLTGKSTVGMAKKVSKVEGVENVKKADPAFFFINRLSTGSECNLESAVQQGTYLSWSGGKLEMKQYGKDVILDVQQNVLFEITELKELETSL
ncbi:hypothetical protein ScPMuIL_018891 [Solemya velum]